MKRDRRTLAEREQALGLVLEVANPQASVLTDRWGNEVVSEFGVLGQYTIRSAFDGRLISVCGEALTPEHLTFWDYSAGEQRMKCVRCFGRKGGDW